MSKPTHSTSMATLAASGLRSRVHTLSDSGSREPRLERSHDRVRPESMMSSTIRTCLPLMSVSRSLRIRTTPEDWVPAPYDDTAIQSMVTGVDSARARSAMTITAPLRTPTISRSLPAYSASIFAASSTSFASISSLVMSTSLRSAPMSFASPASLSVVPPAVRRSPGGAKGSALPNHQSATLALGDDLAREIDGSLAAPAGDQTVDFLDVTGEERTGRGACLDGRLAQDAAAHRGRQGVELGALQKAGCVAYGGLGPAGPGVEGVGVVAGELGRTGEGLDDSFAERLLQGGQAFVAQPGARVGGVGVVRIVPDGQGLDHAGLAGDLPVEFEEGPAITAVGPRDRGHAGQRAGAGAAGEAEQDGFGLVVAGVAEQDGGGAVTFGRGGEGGVAGGAARGGLGTAFAADGHGGGLDGIQAEFAQPEDDFLGAQVGAGLEAVVDGDAAGADAELGSLEGEGGGEAHGVGTAGAGHEHERRGRALVRALLARDGTISRSGTVGGSRTVGGSVMVVEDVVE